MRQRARRDDDKRERVGAILDAAREVWSRSSWLDFNMDEVAKLAGVVKGTIYLYFPSKEELLLFLFERCLEDFLDDLDRDLVTRLPPADAIAKNLDKHPLFVKLLPVAGSLIEPGDHRRFIDERTRATAALIERRRPATDGLEFLWHALATASGNATVALLRGMGKTK